MALSEISHKIIYPWGEDKTIFKQRRDLRYAKKGELFMRCGGCGKTDFTILVKPNLDGSAKITTASCSLCNKTFQFDDQGKLGGTFKFEEANGIQKRMEINDRPDT